jgi:hypothetical protein
MHTDIILQNIKAPPYCVTQSFVTFSFYVKRQICVHVVNQTAENVKIKGYHGGTRTTVTKL